MDLIFGLILYTIQLLGFTSQSYSELLYRYRIVSAVMSVTDNIQEQKTLIRIVRWETFFVEKYSTTLCKGHAWGPWQIVPRGLVERKRLCVSLEQDAALALERVHESEQLCRKNSDNEKLAWYTGGNCNDKQSKMLSRMRWAN